MRILFLSRWFPDPPDNGSRIRIYNLIRQLANRGDEVALISFVEQARPLKKNSTLHHYCTEIHTIPYRRVQRTGLSAILALLSARPRSVVESYSGEMEQCSCRVAARFQPDLVIASEIDMAPYALLLRNSKRLLEELELSVLREAAAATNDRLISLRHTLTWQKHQRYVASLLQHFDGCTVVSDQEYRALQAFASNRMPIQVVPNGVDLARMSGDFGQPQPNSLIYTGALTYHANLDAMRYFAQEIFPIVVRGNPASTLKITGKTTAVAAKDLPTHPNLTLTGYLNDLRPAIAQSYLSIVPLRIGGGTRLKILESLALGTPVVTTSKGIEGLQIAHGDGILVADTPADFAQSILTLQQDPTLRHQLSQAGRNAVQGYDWRQIGTTLYTFIDEIMTSLPRRADWKAA